MLPGMNPRAMKQAMKKMGIKQEDVPATEVIIKLQNGKDLVIRNPQVTKVNMMGQETFQVAGTAQEVSSISQEDIKTVMDQTGRSEEEATVALTRAEGDLAQAILDLQE